MADDIRLRRAADTVRLLAADAVQKANSGHPGLPMGCADFAFTLWHQFLRHDPADPQWLGRDRFVLSAGHGSMLTYALLHLFEYGLTLEDLQQFRQWESRTPGHPEYGLTPGVEVTTGPLGTGFGSAVGMAIAAKQLAARLGDAELFGQRVFVLCGDGCMMEGVTQEAASLAGHQKLDNLIVFYDDNRITIEGATDLAFSDDIAAKFRAYGWSVQRVDGQDGQQIAKALSAAVANSGSPSLIIGRTTIGYGAPHKAGQHSAHGEPLGEEEVNAAHAALGFPATRFHVPEDVRELCRARVAELRQAAEAWQTRFQAWRQSHPQEAALLEQLRQRSVPANLLHELLRAMPAKPMATRSSGGEIMQRAAELVPALCGGAADLNPSTRTHLKAFPDFTPADRSGRNVHFGVRELAMGVCANGMALYGTAIPFTATFAVFSDFMKPAIRLAAIQNLHVIFVFTHDSIFVGEDGPTHQPIEQLAMLRAIPGLTVIRPAESNEVAHAWATALQATGPVALFLTRQNVDNLTAEQAARVNVSRGGYVVSDDAGADLLVIATGSELQLALQAAALLRAEGRRLRVVSMPSWELFEKQDRSYRDSVLSPTCVKRVTVEAGCTFGWDRYAGIAGLKIGIDHFGHSAPLKVLTEKYGLTAAAIAARIRQYVA